MNNGWDSIATTNLFQTLEGQVSLMSNKSLTWNLQGGRSCRNNRYSFPFLSNLAARLEYRHDISSAHPFPNSGPFVTFVCPAGRCISTAHTYSGQDTLESALILKF